MKKFIKFFSYALILTSIATMVSGCSNRANTTKQTRPFTIWSFESEDTWKPLIDPISKSLGGQEVVYVKKKLDSSYENNALNSILSGQGPDIWAIPNDWVFRHKDKITPLPDDLVKDVNLDNDYVPAVKQTCMIEGKLYCLSPFLDSLMVYYNPAIFSKASTAYEESHQVDSNLSEEQKDSMLKENERVQNLLSSPPATWTDFSETSRRLTQRDGTNISQAGVAMGTTTNIPRAVDILYALMLQNGTQMTSEDLKLATFSLPEKNSTSSQNVPAKRALDFYTSFSNPSSPNFTWSATMPKDIEAFVTGKAAMMIGFKTLQAYLAQNYPTFDFKTANLPQIGDSETNIVDLSSGYSLVAPNMSSNVSTAWETIINIAKGDYVIETDASLPSTLKDPNFAPSLQDRASQDTDKEVQTAKAWMKGRYPVELDNIFKAIIDKANTEPGNSQAFLDNGAVEATNLLKKTDW